MKARPGACTGSLDVVVVIVIVIVVVITIVICLLTVTGAFIRTGETWHGAEAGCDAKLSFFGLILQNLGSGAAFQKSKEVFSLFWYGHGKQGQRKSQSLLGISD